MLNLLKTKLMNMWPLLVVRLLLLHNNTITITAIGDLLAVGASISWFEFRVCMYVCVHTIAGNQILTM
jgi:hypothetical protein